MLNVVKSLPGALGTLILACAMSSVGCHAQVPATGVGSVLSPELHRRVEVLIRTKLEIPPNYTVEIGPRMKAEVPNYDSIQVVLLGEGKTSHATFLLSDDGKTLAQLNKFDLSQDPKTIVSGAGRPSRGGTDTAPVSIVGFDDLECPYCAKMHAQLFPALLERYKNQVRIVYLDFPLTQHPWAMRAAVDVNCLAAQSQPGYWNLVDYIHLHAAELGGTEKSVDKANLELDKLTLDEGKREHVNEETLAACVKQQDHTAIDASLKLGETLGVGATPVLFINGEKLEGAYPLENVFRMVDGALIAAGQTPPPAPVATVPDTKAAPEAKTATPNPKPGS